MMSVPVIKTEHLSKKYGERTILEDVTVSIAEGEIFGFIGPSGSGKSTLLRMLDLIETPTSGDLEIFGEPVRDAGAKFEMRRRMAFLTQKPVVFNRNTLDNVAIGMEYRKASRGEIHKAVKEALESIGLAGYEERQGRTLSGGEAQRVALARAVVTAPEILFLDEPTANLDPISAETIEKMILRLNREQGMTIVFSTHDMIQGQRLADRIGVIMDRTISQTGTTTDIFHQPSTKNIARFVGVDNIFPGVVRENHDGQAILDTGGLPVEAITSLAPGSRIFAMFRADDVTLYLDPVTRSSARNSYRGTIRRLVPNGPFVNVVVDCGIEISALVTTRSCEHLGLAPGLECGVSFKATAVHVIPDTQGMPGDSVN